MLFRSLKWESKHRLDSTWESYGQRKIACEEEIQKINKMDHIILRPSLIYGKYDYSDRFYYWLKRIKNEEQVEIPEDFNKPVNYTFSEDFAKVIIHFIETNHDHNVYNVVTHKANSLTSILNESKQFLKSNSTLVPVKLNLKDQFENPLWFPDEHQEISAKRLQDEFDFKFKSLKESLRLTIKHI